MKKVLEIISKSMDMLLIDEPGTIDRFEIDQDRVKELAASISEVGLLQPILLRPVEKRFEIIAGHRRFLAHKFLGLLEIP